MFLSDPGTVLGPNTKKQNKAVNSGGIEGELGHGGHMPTEVMREKRVKKTGDRGQVIAEAPCHGQDHTALKAGGQRSYVIGIFLKVGKKQKSLSSYSSCLSGPPLMGCCGWTSNLPSTLPIIPSQFHFLQAPGDSTLGLSAPTHGRILAARNRTEPWVT